MNKKETELVLTHLKYIKERVDANFNHLEKLNGRVRSNEVTLSWMKGIGSTITFIISCVLGYLIKE
tara:strand:+ start:729 stop:926 length:198 start_codon:yes stop_codon:yes gene_type:complete